MVWADPEANAVEGRAPNEQFSSDDALICIERLRYPRRDVHVEHFQLGELHQSTMQSEPL